MIDETTIKEKYFECDLERLIGQIHFIALSLMQPENADSLECNDLVGAGYVLSDVARDLETIKDALYRE